MRQDVKTSIKNQGEFGILDWRLATEPVDYEQAVSFMEQHVANIQNHQAGELAWAVEHPSLYTAGVSARPEDLLNGAELPVYPSGRGGQYTWHGPGQRVVYVMLDLSRRGRDVRRFVCDLEKWLIASLAELNIVALRREGRVGIWVPRHDGSGCDDKIAAIGIRIRHWISFHGVALNRDCDLTAYRGIVPCGVREHGVCSLASLGVQITAHELDEILERNFRRQFEEISGGGCG